MRLQISVIGREGRGGERRGGSEVRGGVVPLQFLPAPEKQHWVHFAVV